VYPWRKILIPTDFSTASRWAFDHALQAASTTDAELIVLHVRLLNRARPGELRFPADPSVYSYVEQQELEVLRAHAEKHKPEVTLRLQVRQGIDAATEILSAALDEKADLVVIATHTQHAIAHLFIGSTTMAVLSRCVVPVLAIRYGTRQPGPIRRIAVPYTPGAAPSIERASAIARQENGEVTLLAIAEKANLGKAVEDARHAAADVAGVNVSAIGIEGKDAGKETVRFAAANRIDLIALSPGCAPGGEVSVTAEWIVRHTSTPVLVVS
jgi:Universal stress protein UspA and related nucleotide-binding proteins